MYVSKYKPHMNFTFCLHLNTFSVMWLYALSPTFMCAKQRNHKKNAVEEKSEWKWIESIDTYSKTIHIIHRKVPSGSTKMGTDAKKMYIQRK